MKILTRHWLRGLAATFITGIATTFLSVLGISGAEMVGLKVQQIDWKQAAVLSLVGGVVGAAAYLKQSPIPPEESSNEKDSANF